jgi:ABC-type uncharacterized transport system permease subunit
MWLKLAKNGKNCANFKLF